MKLLTPQPHGTIVQFIEDRMSHNWRSPEQSEAMVREYFYILAEIVCDPDSCFSDESRASFPVLPVDVTLENCVLWLIALTLWQFGLVRAEQAALGKAKVTWA